MPTTKENTTTKSRTTPFMTMIPVEVLKAFKERCATNGRSMTTVMKRLMTAYVHNVKVADIIEHASSPQN